MVDYSNVPRDSRRVPLATTVQFKFDRFSGFLSEYSSNISPTGMFIVAETPEPPGRILDLEFRLGDGFEIIKGQGEVVWTRTALEGPGRLPGMGIRFLELSPGSKELIYRVVDQYVAQGGTPFDLTGTPFDLTGARPANVPTPSAASETFEDVALPPLAREPDPFPDLEGRDATVLPWSPASQKETPMSGEDVLPPLEPLDEIFRLEEMPPPSPVISPATLSDTAPAKASSAAPGVLPFPGPPLAPPQPAPANDPFPLLAPDLDLTQAGPTVVGFDEPIPDPPSYPGDSSMASPADDLFASYLPQPAAPPESPQVRPLSTLAGGASVQQPKHVFPWVLVGVLLAVAAAVFLLRGQISSWIGGGGGEAEIVATQPARPLPRPVAPGPASTLQEEISLTSDAAASTAEPAQATPQEPPAEPEPQRLPEIVQRKPAPAPAPAAPVAPAGPAVTAIDRITFEPALGGTTVILWGNGAIRPESFKQSSVDSPPREVIQIRGVQRPFAPTRIPVGTSEVKQIRVGYHEKPGGNELHVVIDLAGPRVKVARIEPDGQRLRIHLQTLQAR